MRPVTISVVIPALDEADGIVEAVESALDPEASRAAADLEGALDDPLVGFEASLRLAAVQALRGQHAAAESLLQRLLEDHPEDPGVHLVAAHLALARGLPRRARSHAERALAAAPELREAQALRDAICSEIEC